MEIKKFEDFKKTILKSLSKREYYNDIYLESMRDYFGDDIPNCVYESMESGVHKDYILENLKSHDIDLLCKKINQKFGKDTEMYFLSLNHKDSSFELICYDKIDEDELKNLLDFFGYYITQSGKENDEYFYVISPIYAKDANNLVYTKNHGKLYHFSTGENAKDIEKVGLRCKSAKYRYFPKRIYAYASDKKLNQIPDIFDKIKDVVNPQQAQQYGIYIYQIDLNKSKKDTYINFYEDDVMEDGDAVYTYNNIPPECITLVDVIRP